MSFTFPQACEWIRLAAGVSCTHAATVRDWIPQLTSDQIINAFLYVAAIFFIVWIVILSNREIRLSRKQIADVERSLELERNTLERSLARRTDDFIRSEQARSIELQKNAQFGELSKGLFHDLMNPLSAIALYLETMRAQKHPFPEIENIMEKTIGASRRMQEYMNAIKRTIHSGTGNVGNRHTDVGAEIILVRDLLAFKARAARVSIVLARMDEAFLPIQPIRMHQVILNLVSNAIEACEAHPQVTVTNEHEVHISLSKKDTEITLTVRDTGCGISPENLKLIFRESFTTKTHGTGIGLMTVKNIVEKELGGNVEVRSDVGVGTTFVVRVPLRTV